jgi:prepilin-type N-terminal cleavage/methylation domain-containing protein
MKTRQFRRRSCFWLAERKLRGFSLVELVLVICILSIIAGMAVPRFANAVTRNRAEAAAKRVVEDLTLAQRRARLSSAPQHVLFDGTAGTYRLAGLADPDHPGAEYVVRLGDPPYEVSIANIVFGTDSEIIFDGYGVPDTGGSLIVQVSDYARLISIAAGTGRVTVTETPPVSEAAN